MKKIILIISVLIACLGCVAEGPHEGCGRFLKLVFTHEGNVADFDKLVARDIRLVMYDAQGAHLYERTVPYSEIRGGKPFYIEQKYAGRTYIAAWAVSGTRSGRMLPDFENGDDRSTARFVMHRSAGMQVDERIGSDQNLYLGCVDFEQDPQSEITVEVPVRDRLCNVVVRVEDAQQLINAFPGTLEINISGSSDAYLVAGESQSGDRVTVIGAFAHDTAGNTLSAQDMIMPASKNPSTNTDDDVVVTITENGTGRILVDTETKATSGQTIEIVINPITTQVQITVGTWQIRKQYVTL